MVILEGLITNIIGKIGEMAAGKAWASMPRNHKVMKLFKAVGLKPGKPEPDFDSVYVHALVEYGVEQPKKSILDFFKHEDIREAFRNSFDNNDLAILHNEAPALIKWNIIVDDLRDEDIDPRLEFARFTLVFNEMVDRTRTPAEVRREHKLDEILQVIKGSDLNMIRAKQLEMIQGGRPEQLKTWFRTLGYGFGGHDICTDEYCERLGLESAYVIDGDRVEWQRVSTGFRLPTDAEWEYACRAGATTRFACGDLESSLGTMGWYGQNSKGGTKSVGLKRPNFWGLFDMHGNVWEWTWDSFKGGSLRVVRGGSWYYVAYDCRSAFRRNIPPDYRYHNLGFRLSRSVSLGP